MADAALSYAIETVGNILIEEGKLLYGVKGQVKEMQRELKWMHGFLEDADRRKGEDKRVQICVSEIREAAYNAEDVIERFVLKSALRNPNQKGVMNRIKKYASFIINHPAELHQVGFRIAAINTNLSNLERRLQTYNIIREEASSAGALATGRRKRQDYPHVIDHNVVGLDGKITELVEHLLDVEASPLVVCLYGMGGLGKTTTAKKVYSDSRIRAHFDGFAWVYISQQCNHRQVLESILTQLSGNKESMTEDQSLKSQLYSIQKERKCLLVIDDIWNSQDWDKLSPAFPYMDEDGRSKILLTSRNQSVVSHRVYSTSLDILDHANSLELLKNTVLSLGGPNHPSSEMLSKDKYVGEMVKQCAGLPLAIVVLGGILATKHELAEWKRVGDNIKLALKRGEQKGTQGVNSVLESSYEDLPYNLKSCFLYFSQYREDEEIKVTDLIQKWIGEGFISSSVEGDETMEDVADGYLNEMVRRCMIQVGKRGHTGRVKTCRMHDLMRDLCISKAKEESFAHTVDLRVENEGTILERVSVRRLCISSSESGYILGRSMLSSLVEISPQLRSILFRDFSKGLIRIVYFDDDQAKAVGLIMEKLKLVRILQLTRSSSYLTKKIWRVHIGNLIHLRLLDLDRGYGITMIPTSIGNLRCLQTLKLKNCDSDLKIPDSIWGMEQLRHLYLPDGGGVCESNKQRVGNLRNLQTLVNFPPKKFDMKQNLVKFTSIRKLTTSSNWEGKDGIMRSREIVFNRMQSLTLNLEEFKYRDLEGITRGCPCLHRLVVRVHETEVLNMTVCISIWPSNLTKLVLWGTRLDQRHMGPLAKLQSLKVLFLKVHAFIGKEMIFHANDFPKLHHLKLKQLWELEAWRVHEGALPSLVCLEITYCRMLKSVADGSQFLKQLKELKFTGMPYSFKRRVEQDWVRVSHDVPSISFANIDEPAPREELDISSPLKFSFGS